MLSKEEVGQALSKELIQKVLYAALRNGGDFAEVFVEKRLSDSISLEGGRVERVKTGFDLGAGIRVVNGEGVSYVFTDDLDEAAVLAAARLAGSAARATSRTALIDLRPHSALSPHRITIRPETVARTRKVELLMRADQAARAVDTRISQVMVGYVDSVQNVIIANSEGLWEEDERVHTRLAVTAVASRGDVIQTGYEAPGKHMGFELFEKFLPEKIGQTAATRAITMLHARPAPVGKMAVVISNGFGGAMFHEASGHGLEADFIQKGSSVFAGRLGEQVASPLVTAIDDATLANEWGSFRVDDEGTPAQRTVLIENGILRSYMYDRKAAAKDKRHSTGNGRRESYQDLPLPRMTNTFIAPGESTQEEIIAATKHGLFAKVLSGGEVNPATGDFVFVVSEGYLIRDGRIAEPVRGAALIGNGPESLKKIDMVGNDLALAAGMCGKGGQSVPASVGQPTLRIAELTVGGTQRD
ncbi:MAG: TldD/PmbA family protein [Syntrophothermus sp.]